MLRTDEHASPAPLRWATSTAAANCRPEFAPGPVYRSFEQFRTAGSTSLDQSIKPGCVATLQTKSGVLRILRDEDFQRLIGLASEVHRLKIGYTMILKAARVVAKHQDQESIELLVSSASMVSESCALPERDGHDLFDITPEEAVENREELIDITEIPRPKL